ncbi:hypothetical protein CL632_01425 [bacterium]|jgi:hypothetical protein|nr:hypothetical protein [bacterium]MDP6571630.1 hypothetical protein [Patescibacteria group bacterium]|tara:strand:- start:2884 stop:3156 length:273 start_codon:yes stop_codon:yes gene_type:complete
MDKTVALLVVASFMAGGIVHEASITAWIIIVFGGVGTAWIFPVISAHEKTTTEDPYVKLEGELKEALSDFAKAIRKDVINEVGAMQKKSS